MEEPFAVTEARKLLIRAVGQGIKIKSFWIVKPKTGIEYKIHFQMPDGKSHICRYSLILLDSDWDSYEWYVALTESNK